MTGLLGRLFGPLTEAMSGVLETFHSLGAPWWLSIVLLTVLVRALLFPLTVKQVKSARAMQELKPEMDEIRSKYKDDRRKQQEAMTELYKERRVNPLAGFLPVLVQIPVFVTMYRVVRLHEQTFPGFADGGLLWFADLTKADPYFVLPVISASILVAAGEISARNVDPAQRRMMRLLPVAFTAFIARFPAGLFVYWITSNTVTLIQNYLIYHRRPGRPLRQGLREHPEGSSDRCAGGPTDAKSASSATKRSVKRRVARKRKKRKKR